MAGLVVMLGLLAVSGRMGAFCKALVTPARIGLLSISSVLIAVNWLTFVYAIESSRLMDASLGYFINPLVSVALGVVFLGERLRRMQWLAVAIATSGVVWLTVSAGTLPWISVVLALSFGLYGLIRKRVDADAATGLTVECAILFLPSLAVLWWLGQTAVSGSPDAGGAGVSAVVGEAGSSTGAEWWLLVLAGPMTALPLVWFAAAARRLPLSTIGLLQYIAPSGQFLLSWLAFGEQLTTSRLIAFAIIWTALVVYTVDAYRNRSRKGRAVVGPHAAIAVEKE